MTAAWCLLGALALATLALAGLGGLGVLVVRVRRWNRRQAEAHEAWLRGIHESDREITLVDEIRRRPSPQPERRE